MKLFRGVDQQVKKLTGQTTIDLDESAISTIESGGTARRESVGKLKKRKSRLLSKDTSSIGTARDGVDILTMKLERNPDETDSSLELILNTLCKSFAMKPKQAAALLTNNNQFLIHSIVKGVKGNYEPLLAWYSAIQTSMKHLTNLLELETEQLPKLLNIPQVLGPLASGLFSQNIDICRQSLEILITMN